MVLHINIKIKKQDYKEHNLHYRRFCSTILISFPQHSIYNLFIKSKVREFYYQIIQVYLDIYLQIHSL